MLCTLIDIGSNTVKMSIFECKKSFFSLEYKTSRMCRLISFVENNIMNEEGIALLIASLNEFIAISQRNNSKKIFAFATASLRRAKNADRIIKRIKKETGIEIELISSENEALMSFKAVYSKTVRTKNERGITSDMGGGSTEFVFFGSGRVVFNTSLEIGCLSLAQKFVSDIIPTAVEWEAIKAYVHDTLSLSGIKTEYSDTLYTIGGSGRALALLYMEMSGKILDDDNGFEMEVSSYAKVRDMYLDINNFPRLTSILPERYSITLPALAAYEAIFEYIGVKKTITSSAGMREGYMQTLIERGTVGE